MANEGKEVTIFDVDKLKLSAKEVYDYAKDSLVKSGTPLKEHSLAIHDAIVLALPEKWENWGVEDFEIAQNFYDEISEHIKIITNTKGNTELDLIKDKSHKLWKGVKAAIDDIQGPLPGDKNKLMTFIRAWRNRKDAEDRERANQLRKEAEEKEEEERLKLAEELEKEGKTEEAEKVLDEEVFIPEPVVTSSVPKGGPARRVNWKYKVVDFAKLPDKFKIENSKMLGETARSHKDKAEVPGVKFWSE
jgi:hypothetical protein